MEAVSGSAKLRLKQAYWECKYKLLDWRKQLIVMSTCPGKINISDAKFWLGIAKWEKKRKRELLWAFVSSCVTMLEVAKPKQ